MSVSTAPSTGLDLTLSPAELLAHNVSRLRRARQISAVALSLQLGWPVSRLEALEQAGGAELLLDDIDQLSHALCAEPAELFAAL